MSSRFQIAELRVWAAIGVAAVGLGCASFEAARLYQTGTYALDRGESGRAVADLERAAELRPEASEMQNHLGLAYQAAGRPGDAERAFRRAGLYRTRYSKCGGGLPPVIVRSLW